MKILLLNRVENIVAKGVTVFRSPKHEVLKASYCDTPLSGLGLSTSSPLKPVGQLG